MSGLVALVVGCLLVAVGAGATVALLALPSRLDRCAAWWVVATASVVAAVALVGVPGHLRAGPLLATQAALAAVPAVLALRRGRRPWTPHRRARRAWRAVVGEGRRAPWAWLLVCLAGAALGWQALVALLLPPYAYDALSYHLLHVATWVQEGDLAPPPLSLCCAYYPGNAELPATWTAVLLGSDRAVDLVQVVAAAAAAVAVAGIGRTAGLDRRSALAAGSLFLLTPVVLAQAPTAYVDVLQTALVLCALLGLTRFASEPSPRLLLVPVLATAVLVGTKGHGPLWAVALGLAGLVVVVLHVRRGRLGAARAARSLGAAALVCVVLGGWWLVRDAWLTGNPFYPFEVRAGGSTVLAGPYRVGEVLTQPPGGPRPRLVQVAASWAADLAPWRHGTYNYEQREGGLGPLWSWLGVLVVPFVVVSVRRRSPVLVAAVLPFLVLAVQPYAWWSRFTLPLAAVGAVAAVWTVSRLRWRPARLLLQLSVLGLAGAGALLTLVAVNPASQARPLPAWEVASLLGRPAEQRTLGALFLPEYAFVDQIPAGATVVVDVEAPEVRFTYPLFGRGFTRTVLGWQPGAGRVPDDAWVVTSSGRPLDRRMRTTRPAPVSDVRGVRVWAPLG